MSAIYRRRWKQRQETFKEPESFPLDDTKIIYAFVFTSFFLFSVSRDRPEDRQISSILKTLRKFTYVKSA
jgi:hypothetical protein